MRSFFMKSFIAVCLIGVLLYVFFGKRNDDISAVLAQDNVLIIDVRSDAEVAQGMLKQAVHIPHTEITEQIQKHAQSKDQPIVLYCRSGGRAGHAKQALQSMGYTSVSNGGGYSSIKSYFSEK